MARLHVCDRCNDQMPETEVGGFLRLTEQTKVIDHMRMIEGVRQPDGNHRQPRSLEQELCRKCVTELTGWDFTED